MVKYFFAIIFVTGFIGKLNSQQFGGTPPSQKWQQINTDTARIIFPVGLDSQANRIAGIVHELAKSKPISLGDQLKKIDIVLQHRTTIPNAYVGLGPFRSEFYLTPPADNFSQGSVPWNEQLALHEYRHVQQFNNFNHGLSKLMRILFGEDGYALAINAAIPEWFYEGDAVYNETQLTAQGRGKIPQFLNAFPSLTLAQKDYSWMKLRNGSLKDYVPNHYELGFLLVNYGYEKYGAEFWKNVTRDASAFRGLFYPFQAAIKKHAGVNYETFRKDARAYYQSSLLAGPGRAKSMEVGQPVFPVNKNYVTNYYFPYRSGDSLVYLKGGYRHRPAFYLKLGDKEKKIRFRNISIDQQFSYRHGKIAYSSFENHARWNWQDYSVINLVDVSSGQQTRLTSRSKYFSPDISPSGARVAAVQNDATGRSELHVLDISNGSVIQRIHASDISVFSDPKFLDDDHIVTPVRLTNGKMTLAMAEVSTGITMRILPLSFNVLGFPAVDNDIIYFTATYGGNDDVYALRRTDNKIFKITNGPLGNYFVNAGGDKLTWSAFTAEGYQLMEMSKSAINWQPVDTGILERFVTSLPELTQKGNADFLSGNPERQFPTQSYSKAKGLFNFHSWRPYFEDPIYTFSIYGQNVLNTMETEIYYKYNQEDREHGVGASATYGGWFPHINAGTEYTFERRVTDRRWSQLDSRLGVIVPISKSSGQTFKDLRISNYVFLRNEFLKPLADAPSGNTSFLYLMHGVSWIQQVQRATQHIYPRLAWSVNASHRHAVTRFEGYQFYAGTSFYVPGICANHNLILSGAFQQRDTARLLFSSRFASARGYLSYYNTNAGSRLTKLSADYHFPLIHPDWGFGNILYFQRLRANVFYDHQLAYFNNRKNNLELRSVGAEFYADTRWWNQYPFTFGVRVSRLLDNDQLAKLGSGSFVWELVLPVAIIPR
jgi:hypothetical protein